MSTAPVRTLTLTPRGQRYADLMRFDLFALGMMAETYIAIGILDGNPRLLDRSELISALVAAEERGAG